MANDKISEIDNGGHLSEEAVGISDMTFTADNCSSLSNESGLNAVTTSTNGSIFNNEILQKPEQETESLAIVKELSQLLNTQLSSKSVSICVRLIEEGADYGALAELLKNWRRYKDSQTAKSNFKSSKRQREWRT